MDTEVAFNTGDLVLDGTKERALELLGAGLPATTVAASCGVSESYISQLLSQPEFLSRVVELKFRALQRHNKRDCKYDEMEDEILDKLKHQIGMIFDPMKLAKVLQIMNSAKRRGVSSPDTFIQQNTIVQLVLPNALMERFSIKKTVDNQIIEAGDQKLITMQSGSLRDRIRARREEIGEGNENTRIGRTLLPNGSGS